MNSHARPLHGGEIYALAKAKKKSPDQLLDFSSNANIFALPLTQSLVEATPYPFLHYPDTSCTELREALSLHKQTSMDSLLVGNGAAELIWLFLLHVKPKKVLFLGPIFSEYVRACQSLGIAYTICTPPAATGFVPGAKELQCIDESRADLLVICTPNNPAACTYPDIGTILGSTHVPYVFVDNSYLDFLAGTPAYEENSYQNYTQKVNPKTRVVTLGSFTKFYCCPGIRLGYMTGPASLVAAMNAQRPSWSVSPFAQLAGTRLLHEFKQYCLTLPSLFQAVEATGNMVRSLSLFNPKAVWEGPGFLCCGLRQGVTAEGLFLALLDQDIIIRNCNSIPGMPSNYIRIQARPEHDMHQLQQALKMITPNV